MAKGKLLKPGQIALVSGQYAVLHNGQGTGQEVTAVQGKPLPPTPRPGDRFVLVDPTKHKD